MSNKDSFYQQAIEFFRLKSKGKINNSFHEITINFHPDRFTKNGLPVLQAIKIDQELKSQFETGTSNGGLTAYYGGDRWRWEHNVFDGVYDNCSAFQRPKYGALNYKKLSTGGSPRFGSAYFRLKREIIQRVTFCYPDSYFEPVNFATYEYLDSLIELASKGNLDELDNYIEAQIHGKIDIKTDMEAIVLDPIYKGTIIEEQAMQLPLKVEWHLGYKLDIKVMEIHPDYRGAKYVEIARKIAKEGSINPKILGDAINILGYNQQEIKKIWHYLARFGYRSD